MVNQEIYNSILKSELLRSLRKYYQEKGFNELWSLFKEITYEESRKFFNNKITQFELACPAVANLSTKENLNHIERTTLLFIYMRFGKKGEERLLEILKQQRNYKESICRRNIEDYKKKKEHPMISCGKLVEWRICNESFNDCHKYQITKEEKNAKPI